MPSAALKVTGLGVTSCATGKSAGNAPAPRAERCLPSRSTMATAGGCCALAETKAIVRSLAVTGCHSSVSPEVSSTAPGWSTGNAEQVAAIVVVPRSLPVLAS